MHATKHIVMKIEKAAGQGETSFRDVKFSTDLYISSLLEQAWAYNTVKSRFNEWPPSAHFDSLNRDFLMYNYILVTRFVWFSLM